MKTFKLWVLCFIVMIKATSGLTSEYYYFYFSKKINLEKVEDEYGILFKDQINFTQKIDILYNPDIQIIKLREKDGIYSIIKIKNQNVIKSLEESSSITHISPIFKFKNDASCIIPNRFIAQFRKEIDMSTIDSLNKKYGVSIISKGNDIENNYLLKVDKITSLLNISALELANLYNDLPQVEYAEPDFIIWGNFLHDVVPNDPFFED